MEQELIQKLLLLTILKDYAIPFLALAISICALWVSIVYNRRTSRKQILKEILDEFRSEKMGSFIVDIWNFYHIDHKTLVERYLEEYKSTGNKPDSIHIKRRYVSQYFQQVALYYYENYISKNDLKKFWGESTISVIKKIIYPIEYEALDRILEIKNEPKPERIQMMIRLHNELNYNDKIILTTYNKV